MPAPSASVRALIARAALHQASDRSAPRHFAEWRTRLCEVPAGTPNGPSWYTTGNNQMTGVPYDPAGNGSPTFGKTYHYDVENRMSAGYSYDHSGKRVWKGSATTYELTFYDIGGRRLETKTCAIAGSAKESR